MHKLGVMVWDMGVLGGQGTEDMPQAAQGLIDGAGTLPQIASDSTSADEAPAIAAPNAKSLH